MASTSRTVSLTDQADPAPHMPPSGGGWRGIAPRLLAAVWLVLLGSPLKLLLDSDPPPVQLSLGLLGLILFIATYIWQLWYHPLVSEPVDPRPAFTRWLPVIVLTAISTLMTLGFGESFITLFVFAGVSTGIPLPKATAVRVLLAVIGFATFSGAIAGANWSTIAGTDLTIFGIGALIILLAHLTLTIRELRAARLEIARLAVAEERLRFSRDLHDLLGHSLSLITLKSELAGRLMATNPEKSAAEIHDIERIARSALQETREAVAGYRQPSLASELGAAREILGAAGISFVSNGASIEVPPDVETVLAWTVREGVTNVIRHSRATQCVIRVNNADGKAAIEVIDNGSGGALPARRTGSGLQGLTERVAALGGRFEGGPRSEGGFRLSVAIPLAMPKEAVPQPELARTA